MDDLTFRSPHVRDIVELGARMRRVDRDELAACNHFDALAAVEHSVRQSSMCWAVLKDGEVLCAFGVCPLAGHPGVGTPWFLGTSAASSHARSLIAAPAEYIARMLDAFPRLVNFVHADNAASLRWLRHLGFSIDPAAPFGPNGAPFHRFEMKR